MPQRGRAGGPHTGPHTGPTGHVIVCGLHDEGLRLVEQLHASGVPCLVVDDQPDPDLVRSLDSLGVRLISADSRLRETLVEAGLAEATALVCVESQDLHSLATALLARELRPDLRIVAALTNAAVGRALAGAGFAVLDVARLAAPSVAEACLGARTRELTLPDGEYVVVEHQVAHAGSLRDLYGELVPLAVQAVGDRPDLVAPGRDELVEAGDQVALLGPEGVVRRAGLVPRHGSGRAGTHQGFVGARAPRVSGPRRTSLPVYLLRTADRRVVVASVALLLLVVTSISILLAGYREPGGRRMSVLDALYFTVETIGTVGYGDFYFRDQPSWLRAWAIVLMIVGATLATVFFALLTNSLISRTLGRGLGGRRLTGLADHVVVVGAGSVGIAVVEELLARGADVAVIEADQDNRFLGQLRSMKVPVAIGDATLTVTLRAAQLPRAAAVAVMTSDDLANIETGLAVRDLLESTRDDPDDAEPPVVLRLFEQPLQHTVAVSFGFREVRSPAALAAPWFVGAALGLDVLQTFYAGGRPMLLARAGVGPRLTGLAMHQLGARIRVVTVRREDGTTISLPRRDLTLAAGDVVHLVGPYEELLTLLRGDAGQVGQVGQAAATEASPSSSRPTSSGEV